MFVSTGEPCLFDISMRLTGTRNCSPGGQSCRFWDVKRHFERYQEPPSLVADSDGSQAGARDWLYLY